MSESKHTPGPWKWRDGYAGLDGPGGATILKHEAYEGMWLPTSEGDWGEANAHLIAASPDLVGVAKAFVAHYPVGTNPFLDAAYRDALGAIAKAEGRS